MTDVGSTLAAGEHGEDSGLAMPQDFDALLLRAMAQPWFAHLAGDGIAYRQALAVPVASKEDQIIAAQPGNALDLLVERANGQVMALRLLDPESRPLQLDSFLKTLEDVLPAGMETDGDVHALEAEVAQRTGYPITMNPASVLLGSSCFHFDALPGLATNLLDEVTVSSQSGSAAELESARARLIDGLTRQLDAALAAFRSQLDPRIIAALFRSGNTVTSASYNRYQGLAPAARHRRLQAAEAFPLLGDLLIDPARKFAPIRNSVERKQELIPAVAKVFQVPQEVARWMRGIPDISHVGHQWLGKIDVLARLMAHICREHRPQSADDWLTFNHFLFSLEELDTRTEGSSSTPRFSVLPGMLAKLGKIGWGKVDAHLAGLGAEALDLADMADLIAEIIEVFAGMIGEEGTLSDLLMEELIPVIKKLYCSIGIAKQLRASLYWHQLLLAPDEEEATVTPRRPRKPATVTILKQWPAPFDGVIELAGQRALCLTSAAQLDDEGKQMQHCVRGYSHNCMYGGSSIISIRSPEGLRLSTLELILNADPSGALQFRVSQHRGRKNAAPSPAAIHAARVLLPILNGSAFAEQRQHLQKAQQERIALRPARSFPFGGGDVQRTGRLRRALGVHLGYARFFDEAVRHASER